MAIESALDPNATLLPMQEIGDEVISVEMPVPDSEFDNIVVLETEDGGMLIDFDPEDEIDEVVEFDDNLADFMDDRELGKLSSELVSLAKSDLDSRKDWEETYVKGLEQLGMKISWLRLSLDSKRKRSRRYSRTQVRSRSKYLAR